MNKRILAATAVMLVISSVVVAVGVGQVSANFDLSWHVIGGGGKRSTSANHIVMGTIGQPVVGVVTNAVHEVCAGFWCATVVQYRACLPLVLKNYVH